MATYFRFFFLHIWVNYLLCMGALAPRPPKNLNPKRDSPESECGNKCFVVGIYVGDVFVLSPNKLAHCGRELLRYPFLKTIACSASIVVYLTCVHDLIVFVHHCEMDASPNNTGAPAGDSDRRMKPFARLSSIYSLRATSSFCARLYRGPNGGTAPGSRVIAWSHVRCGGRVPSGRSKNNGRNSEYISGRVTVATAVANDSTGRSSDGGGGGGSMSEA